MLDETAYRSLVQACLDRVERAFENVDPDVAECEKAHGGLSITLVFVASSSSLAAGGSGA